MRAALLLVICACGPALEPRGVARQPIYGGVPAPNDEAVFYIADSMGACSATLIAPRTLLTAAHCISGETLTADNAPSSTETYTSVETLTSQAADLALVQLDRAPPLAPKPWNWWTRRPLIGSPIRHVGYGLTEDGTSGERRMVETTVTRIEDAFQYGVGIATGSPGVGVCFGDSGGPALLEVLDGGPESVLGVHSHLNSVNCGPAVSVLVPHYRTFIEGWLKTHEDAGCPRDDRCVSGCAPVDPDCVCGLDGMCPAACEDLIDPDCPPDCRADGVCSAGACPRLDEDCTAPGDDCRRDAQCPGRRCINDRQHVNTYCSAACGAGCPAGFQCDATRDVCIKEQLPEVYLGAACNASTFCIDSECLEGACRESCNGDIDCPRSDLCRVQAPRYCTPRPVFLAGLNAEWPAATERRCEAGAGLPLALLAAAWLRRRRR